MKLLNKTSIYYLLFALPVFVVCSLFLYNLVSSEIQDSVDESLWKEKVRAEERLRSGKAITEESEFITLLPMGNLKASDRPVFSDTLIYDSIEEEMIPYRVMASVISDGNNTHYFIVRKSTMESDDLIESIIYPVILLFIILLLGFFLLNIIISRRLWSPFYKTLKQLEQFRITEDPVRFDAASIREFSELNRTLTVMTEKIYSDYTSQKQFIENASHEIQTPLAVIRNKLELLVQSSSLTGKDMEIIQSVYNATNKLSSLNKALLLLSKIGNDQFRDTENVEFKSLTEKTLEHFEGLASIKNIRIMREHTSTLNHEMNPVLADILISNLLQNAIRHNTVNGQMNIAVSAKKIVISNTSDQTVTDTGKLFNRFSKNEASAESVGLGLSIVKEICDKYDIRIVYNCTDNVHTVVLEYQS